MATIWSIIVNRIDGAGVVWKEWRSKLISVSSGPPDAGSIPMLGPDGKIDPSMVTGGSGTVFTTDNVPEGLINLYFTAARVAGKADTTYVDTQDGIVLTSAEAYTDAAIAGQVSAAGSSFSGIVFTSGDGIVNLKDSGSGTISASLITPLNGLDFLQFANGNDVITGNRVTDTTPTGTFLDFKNAINDTHLWTVDITGKLTAGDVPVARVSGFVPPASITGSAHNWLHAYNALTGVFTESQPDYSDLTGAPSLAAIATSGKWSDLQAATAALTLANGTNATTFNQTSAVAWSWANTSSSSANSTTVFSGGDVSTGWNAFTGTVDAVTGNPAPSLKFAPGQVGNITAGVVPGAVVQFDFYFYNATTPLFDFHFGCDAQGVGPVIRIDGRAASVSEFYTGASFVDRSLTTPTAPVTQTISTLAWHTLKIIIASDGLSAAWYLDGVLQATGVLPQGIRGPYISVDGDAGTNGANIDNITVVTGANTQNSPSLNIKGTYFDGSASQVDNWIIQNTLPSMLNAQSVLSITHSGAAATAIAQGVVAIQNLTAATVGGVNQHSPRLALNGRFWQNGADSLEGWSFQNVIATSKSFTVSNVSETAGSVVTLTVTGHNFVVGEVVTFTNLTQATWLNGLHATVATAPANTITFNDPTLHGLLNSIASSGTCTQSNPVSQLQVAHIGSDRPQIVIPIGTAPGASNTGFVPPITGSSQSVGAGFGPLPGVAAALATFVPGGSDTVHVGYYQGNIRLGQVSSANNSPGNAAVNTSTLVANYAMRFFHSTSTQNRTTGNNAMGTASISFGGNGANVGSMTSLVGDATVLGIGYSNSVACSTQFVPTAGTSNFQSLHIHPLINQASLATAVTSVTITNATTATITVTATAGFTSGQAMTIAGLVNANNLQMNGTWFATIASSTTFTVTNPASTWVAHGASGGENGTITMQAKGNYSTILVEAEETSVGGSLNRLLDLRAGTKVTTGATVTAWSVASQVATLTFNSGPVFTPITGFVKIDGLTGSGAPAGTFQILTATATTLTFSFYGPDASGSSQTGTAIQYGTSQFNVSSRGAVTHNGNDTLLGANGEQWVHGSSTELLTLSTSGTTTDTSANLLPANSIIEAVVARVTTTITTATNWKLGDPTTAGRFTAADAVMTANETQVGLVHIDQVGAAGPRQTAAAKVRVTTTGTPGAGAIRITVFYRQFVAPTS